MGSHLSYVYSLLLYVLFLTGVAFYSTELYTPFKKSREPRLLGALANPSPFNPYKPLKPFSVAL